MSMPDTRIEHYLKALSDPGTPCPHYPEATLSRIETYLEACVHQQKNGGGAVVSLMDYLDPQTFALDVDSFIEAINAGKAFYFSSEGIPGGFPFPESIFNASIENGIIKISGAPTMTANPNGGGDIAFLSFSFDAETGLPVGAGGTTGFTFPNSTTAHGDTMFALGKLTIDIGGNTYEYDGTQDVDITILDGESMGF